MDDTETSLLSPEVMLFYPRPWPGETMSGRLPYPLMLLSAYLQQYNIKASIIDQRTEIDLKAKISTINKNITCFGISSFTGIQIKNGLEIAAILKELFPKIPIVWGGWHSSSLPHQTLEHPLVDFVVRGQGEETFKELVLALRNKKDIADIQGLSYKHENEIFHNPSRPLQPFIENMVMPYEILDVDKYVYKKPFADRSDRTLGIITSLGCPNNCGFCEVASVYNRRVFFRNLDIILEEIDFLVKNYNIESFTIDDDNFFVSKKRTIQFCEALLKKSYRISWDAGVSVDLILSKYDDNLLNMVKDSGCKQLYIGAESGSDRALQLMNKKATVAQTYQFVAKMKEIGIKASLSSMVGLPTMASSEIFDTMNMILKCREINPDFDFRLFYYTPYPSTAMYRLAIEKGFREPTSLEGWSEHTLRQFKAPWLKKAYRNQVKYFYFYYFPYSGQLSLKKCGPGLVGHILDFLCKVFFENGILRSLAKLRTKYRFYKIPIDAYYAIQNNRLRSFYDRIFNKNIDIFYEFDH